MKTDTETESQMENGNGNGNGNEKVELKSTTRYISVLPKIQYEKDIFPLFWYILSFIREQYTGSPPDGRFSFSYLKIIQDRIKVQHYEKFYSCFNEY